MAKQPGIDENDAEGQGDYGLLVLCICTLYRYFAHAHGDVQKRVLKLM